MGKRKSVLIFGLLAIVVVFSIGVNVPIRSDEAWKGYKCLYVVGEGFYGATNDCTWIPESNYVKFEGGLWVFHTVVTTTLAHEWFSIGRVTVTHYAVEQTTGITVQLST